MRSAFVFATLIATGASGSFSHVSAERVSAEDGLQTFRLYANFTTPTDELFGVFASSELAIQFASTAPIVNDGRAVAGTAAEDFAARPFSGPRDTWLTIDHDEAAGNNTIFTPGFLGANGVDSVVKGCEWVLSSGGWFDSQPSTPARGEQVLIAQLTFENTFALSFFMSGTVSWRPSSSAPLVRTSFVVQKSVASCPADLDPDGVIDFGDLLVVLSSWGACEGECPADLTGNGSVDFADLLQLLSHYGATCGE